MPDDAVKEPTQALETIKAAIRAGVEHCFDVIKRPFGYQKVGLNGLSKNTAQSVTLLALSNLWMERRRLVAQSGTAPEQDEKRGTIVFTSSAAGSVESIFAHQHRYADQIGTDGWTAISQRFDRSIPGE